MIVKPKARKLRAVQWTGIDTPELRDITDNFLSTSSPSNPTKKKSFSLWTNGGYKAVNLGDWIIADGKKPTVVSNEEFEQIYEVVSD